jgi:outer membrane protein assembly factor BamB
MPRLLFLLSFLTSSVHGDWQHIRGPNLDGVSNERDIADSWPSSGPPILWSRELGPAYSGIVVAENRVFTLFQNKSGMFLIAMDATNGDELWRLRVDLPWQHGGMYPGPYASPTFHQNVVYYATPTGIVGAVEATTGNSIWTQNVRATFGSQGTEFGFAASPLIEDDLLYLPVGGQGASMVALHVQDGSTAWQNGDDSASYCPAYPITLNSRRLIVGFMRNCLVIHDAKTGTRLWRERLSNSYDEHSVWPLFDGGDRLLISSPFRGGAQLFLLQLHEDHITAKTIWAGKQLSNDVCSSLLSKGAIYGFDIHQAQASPHRPSRGVFKCVDFLTGKTRWESDQIGQASIIAVDGKLLIWNETGTLILARENSERFEELARATILGDAGLSWSPPAISNQRMYLRDHQRIVCVYLGSMSNLDPAQTIEPKREVGAPWNWSKLVPHEPEFPNDPPSRNELTSWFLACTLILMLAFASISLFKLLGFRKRSMGLFLVLTMLLSILGTTLIGTLFDRFVLTWPLALYLVFRLVVRIGSFPNRGWRHQVFARLALLAFVVICLGYYRLCQEVGYAMGWGFLAGFLPVLPALVWIDRRIKGRLRILAEFLSFAIYFWSSGVIPGLKSSFE